MPATLRQPHFALLLGLAWLLAVVQLVAQHWAVTAQTLLDTDDAMRLVQMRDWLAGQGWYDLTQRRLAGGYESHWSRLIDAGLAGTLWVFSLVAEPAMAERLMRTVWPMLWLLPTMGGAAAIAWRIAGRDAALIALLLGVLGFHALYQFRPGRIDHHNVQIALSTLLVAATVWSDRARWAAAAAGAITGVALAIGLECLPYLIVCGVAFALRHVLDASASRASRDYGLALAVSSLVGFFAVVGPAHWSRGFCDAIGINWVALAGIGGLGLALAAQWPPPTWRARLAAVTAIAAAAVLAFLWFEPSCLRGPYAQMMPELHAIWLDHVPEMQPLLRELAKSPLAAVAIATFPAVAVLAAILLLRDPLVRRDPAFLLACAALLAGVLTTLAAIKGYSYATWAGMPLVAVFGLRLFALLRLTSLLPRVAVGLLLTPALLSIGAVTIADAASFGHGNDNASERSCRDTANYAGLAALPPGLVAGNIQVGPFLLALTPHTVLAAPYHRTSGIATAHAIFAAPPDVAHRTLRERKVAYVMVCGSRGPYGLTERERAASLWTELNRGEVPAWLERVNPRELSIAAYRVRP